MGHLLSLTNQNKKSICLLPNGESLFVTTRLRSLAGYWTIQLSDKAGIITDEAPLIQNESLFGELPEIKGKYGIFYVIDNEDNFPLEEHLGNRINLFWENHGFQSQNNS